MARPNNRIDALRPSYFLTRSETSGRYHSKWLNMMYPRLSLARSLLRDDGVIFVSIDDHEVYNLRALMNELFGEENFITTVIWQKVYAPKNTAQHFSEDHDYIVAYARNADIWKPVLLARSEEANAHYRNPDNDPRGDWRADGMSGRNYYSKGQYEIVSPSGKTFLPPKGRYWLVDYDRFQELDRDNRIWWGTNGDNAPAFKRFLTEVKQGMVPQTLWLYSQVGHTQEAKKELLQLVPFENTDNVLDTVKPVRLIQRMIQIATAPTEDHIVLDFFAGSAPTAQAVLRQNLDDGGNRRFICVQLPEPLPVAESRLRTLADIGKTRIHSAITTYSGGGNGQLPLEDLSGQDLGVKVFKLTSSNFETWNADETPKDAAGLAEQLELYADHLVPGRSQLDVLFELLLKAGLPLTARIEEREAAERRVFAVADGLLLICLEDPISQEALRAMMALQPQQVLCLDHAFRENDQLKTNVALEMKSHGIEFHTV
jgi:adenine-specific DNA-methyltransferase